MSHISSQESGGQGDRRIELNSGLQSEHSNKLVPSSIDRLWIRAAQPPQASNKRRPPVCCSGCVVFSGCRDELQPIGRFWRSSRTSSTLLKFTSIKILTLLSCALSRHAQKHRRTDPTLSGKPSRSHLIGHAFPVCVLARGLASVIVNGWRGRCHLQQHQLHIQQNK